MKRPCMGSFQDRQKMKQALIQRVGLEKESMIMAAQEQAIRNNIIKARINETHEESKCRMCGQVDETVNHIISECSKLTQKEKKSVEMIGLGNKSIGNCVVKMGLK